MTPELWGDEAFDPLDPTDESTAQGERRRANERAADAVTGEQRTLEVVSALRGLIGEVQAMHEKNHYVERLLPIFRESHRHVS